MNASSSRDVRLDVFRGLAMFIIFVAHMPGNGWAHYLPREIGPSDAAEWFVFCSGFASAIAFGRVFMDRGVALGTARVVHRAWQIYWAQVASFLLVAALCIWGTQHLNTRDYVQMLNLTPFFNDPQAGVIGLLTLTYIPNYFDILPMYMVVLLGIPIIMTLRMLWPPLAIAAPIALYLCVWAFDWHFSAEWWSDRAWFFNPLAWQLLFFSGFVFGAGWLKMPEPTPLMLSLVGGTLFALFLLNYDPIWNNVAWLNWLSNAHLWMISKTNLGIARYVHFMCLAFMAVAIVRLRPEVLHWPIFKPLVFVGQQTLPVFLSTLVLSWAGGMALDVFGRDIWTTAAVNLTGIACMLAVAAIAGFFKRQPWRRQANHPIKETARHALPQQTSRLQPQAGD